MTCGFSRDDAEAKFLPLYVREGILPADPFEVGASWGAARRPTVSQPLETVLCFKISPCRCAFFKEPASYCTHPPAPPLLPPELDTSGVGELIKIAVQRGRESRPGLHLGICGEHGGDPKS